MKEWERTWRDDLFEVCILWGPTLFATVTILGILVFVRPFTLASLCIALLYSAISGLAYWLAGRSGRYGEGVPIYFGYFISMPSMAIAVVALGVFVVLAAFMLFGVVI